MKNGLKIKYVPLDNLRAWEKNPRKNDKAAEKLASLITSYGFINPIVASPDGTIRAGHTRIKAAQKLGMKEVPVLYVDFGSEEKAIGYSIADNKSVEWANWDEELLSDVMVDLKGLDFDLDMTGFTEIEVDKLIPDDNGEDFNAQEEAQKIANPITKPGEIIQLGRHRVMCGDSTKREDVERLMDGANKYHVIADPPYNIGFNYHGIKDKLNSIEWEKFCKSWFKIWSNTIGLIITPGPRNEKFYPEPKDKGIWIKRNATAGASIFHLRLAEPILFYGKFNHKRDTDVFEYSSGFPNELTAAQRAAGVEKCHAPAKAMSLWKELFLMCGNLVADPFLGNGTSIFAAEKTNRICYGMEIDPIYCDVIRNRYEKYIANN